MVQMALGWDSFRQKAVFDPSGGMVKIVCTTLARMGNWTAPKLTFTSLSTLPNA